MLQLVAYNKYRWTKRGEYAAIDISIFNYTQNEAKVSRKIEVNKFQLSFIPTVFLPK
jgi:hypothetical protein